jgi:hypothetical protein
MRYLLAWYADAAARDPEAWQERRMHVEGVEPHDLVRWHGDLPAVGWVELNVGQPGCGYRATAAGVRVLKQVRKNQTVVDDEVPEILVGNPGGPAWEGSSGDPQPGYRNKRPALAQAASV